MTAVRVLVADALPIFRAGVRTVLVREGGFEVIEAADLDEALALIKDGCPDIGLIDLDLPPAGGVEAVSVLSERCRTRTIVWSFEPTRESVFTAIRAGASGYLRKDVSVSGLLRSLRAVGQGEAPLARDLALLMIDALHRLKESDQARQRAALLSTRELQVLRMVSEGARNREIASRLTISEFTVKRHVQNILQKLELSSRASAAAFYRSAFPDSRTPAKVVAV